MPLSEMRDNLSGRKPKPDRNDLIQRGVIKNIPGLFTPGPKVDGILLSHAHGDHFGLVCQTLQDVPVYLTRGTSKMLMAGSLFVGQEGLTRSRQIILSPGKPVTIGASRVTTFLVDHSSYGSAAFLIETEGKRIVYSGDLRLHGRKPGMGRALLKAIRKAPLDLLVMEGTTLSRGKEPGFTEKEAETLLTDALQQTSSLALAMFSPQNVDRLVSYYRAAIRTGRTLILDPYAAFVLYLIKSECKVPDPFQNNQIRIFIPKSFSRTSAGRRLQRLIPKMEMVEISFAKINSAPRDFLMIFREWMYQALFDGVFPPGSRISYSYWPGYLKGEELKIFRDRMKAENVGFDLIHASGHIHATDLHDFVKKCLPKKIVPVHLANPEDMKRILPEITLSVTDGVPFPL